MGAVESVLERRWSVTAVLLEPPVRVQEWGARPLEPPKPPEAGEATEPAEAEEGKAPV